MHKRMLRVLLGAGGPGGVATPLQAAVTGLVDDAYAYADSSEHHEGIAAFIAKRKPTF